MSAAHNPLVPDTVWAVQTETRIDGPQPVGCVLCGPTSIPAQLFYIQGTSMCADHARTEYATWTASRKH